MSLFLKVNFLLWEIFCRYQNEAISLIEIDVTFKVTSISANEIASFVFPRKAFLKRKLISTLKKFESESKSRYCSLIVAFKVNLSYSTLWDNCFWESSLSSMTYGNCRSFIKEISQRLFPDSICLSKVNDGNTRTTCEISSKLTTKTPEQCHWSRFDVFISTFNRFQTLFWCFHCWLWTSKYRLGSSFAPELSTTTEPFSFYLYSRWSSDYHHTAPRTNKFKTNVWLGYYKLLQNSDFALDRSKIKTKNKLCMQNQIQPSLKLNLKLN